MSFDLSAFLPYQLAVASAQVSRGFSEVYRQEFGRSIPEWRVLVHLSQSESVSIREIHPRINKNKSKVSLAAARLETAGLIVKRENQTDRRQLDMRLTPEGRDLIARIVPLANNFQARLMTILGDSDPEFLHALKNLKELGRKWNDDPLRLLALFRGISRTNCPEPVRPGIHLDPC